MLSGSWLNQDAPAPQGRIIAAVTFPLEELPATIQDRASAWAAFGLRPVHPKHGKAVTAVEFEFFAVPQSTNGAGQEKYFLLASAVGWSFSG